MTIDEAIKHAKSKQKFIGGNHREFLGNVAEWLEELKKYQSYKPVDKEFYKAGYTQAIQDFAEALIPRLTDAIYPKDVEGMRNLINDVAEQLKEGSADNE